MLCHHRARYQRRSCSVELSWKKNALVALVRANEETPCARLSLLPLRAHVTFTAENVKCFRSRKVLYAVRAHAIEICCESLQFIKI